MVPGTNTRRVKLRAELKRYSLNNVKRVLIYLLNNRYSDQHLLGNVTEDEIIYDHQRKFRNKFIKWLIPSIATNLLHKRTPYYLFTFEEIGTHSFR
jgi:hypothetical protein